MDTARTFLEVDLALLKENFKAIKKAAAPLKVIAVIKADAYGSGAEKEAKALYEAGADAFAVSCLAETDPLLAYPIPLHILGPVLDFELPEAVKRGVVIAIGDMASAEKIQKEAQKQGKRVPCHFKLDTGMGRFGLLPEEAPSVIRKAVRMPELDCRGIFSHMPEAGKEDFAQNEEIRNRFLSVLDDLKKDAVTFPWIHIANSPGMNACPFAKAPPFTAGRVGLCLHGVYDDGPRSIPLKETFTLKTRLAAVRKMPKGATLGYSRTCKLEKEELIGYAAIGYADGIPLALSNKGFLLIRGKKCPIKGRIAMDYTAFSLQEFADEGLEIPSPGEIITCLGRDGEEKITVYDWAEMKKTHAYEILCSITARVKRIYKKGE